MHAAGCSGIRFAWTRGPHASCAHLRGWSGLLATVYATRVHNLCHFLRVAEPCLKTKQTNLAEV